MLTKSAIKDFKNLGDRLNKDHLRAYVVSEIADNIHDPVAMNYALEEAGGDEQKTMAYYTKHRIRIIDDELKALCIMMAQSQALKEAANKETGKKSPSIKNPRSRSIFASIVTIVIGGALIGLFSLFLLPAEVIEYWWLVWLVSSSGVLVWKLSGKK